MRPELEELLGWARVAHRERYGTEPVWAAWAPGRVNLIGEHTDYNEGYVLPIAINAWTVATASPRDDRRWYVFSDQFPGEAVELTSPIEPAEPAWANYVRGVIAWASRHVGCELPGLDLMLVSTVPVGGGLSSSAALEVAVATLIEAVTQQSFDPLQKALGCQWAEHHFAGTPCGLMDQLAATFGRQGHALLIDCRTNRVRPVPVDLDRFVLLVADTGVRHELATSEYANRRRACREAADILARQFPHVWTLRDATIEMIDALRDELGELRYRRARHVVTEDQRTVEAAAALVRADYGAFGLQMFDSHRSLRDDYEVSCAELDLLVESAERAGALGARMTGGGFGGCAIVLAAAADATRVQEELAGAFRRSFGRTPRVFPVTAVDGAGYQRLS